ncbi:MAG: dTDP-glucose 4,6-dehydratase [Alteraurantiacibacter sp.]
MANVLVTGGAGFIGGNFVRHRAARHPGEAMTVLDSLTYAGHRETIADIAEANLVVGDICDTALVIRLLQKREIDTIVHFAAESHVDRSIAGPGAFIRTNIEGTHSLLEAARAVWLDSGSGRPHRFHHISTDEVYGSLGLDDPAFTELTPYRPNSPYSASKAASDHLVRAWHRTYGLQATISNCSNNFGPYQHPEKLIPLFILNALHGKPLPIYGDGMNVRDWLHVTDHCRGIALCLERGAAGETYNIGGGAELPNMQVVNAICAEVDQAFADNPALARRFPDAPAAKSEASAMLRTFVEDRKGHDRRYAIDPRKAEVTLGYAPERSFAEGLRDTVRWYCDNENWWRAVQRQ